MNALVFSQKNENPFPTRYQGDEPLKLAYESFVDWREVYHHGELEGFQENALAINRAAFWLLASMTAYSELRQAFRSLNEAIIAKHNAQDVRLQYRSEATTSNKYSVNPGHDASIRIHIFEAKIATIRLPIAKIKFVMEIIQEQRQRSPMVELAYWTLLSEAKLLIPGNVDNTIITAITPIVAALEQSTRLNFLAIDAETTKYHVNMARLARELEPKLARLVEKQSKQEVVGRCVPVDKLLSQQILLTRLARATATARAEAEQGQRAGEEEEEEEEEADDAYLGQIVRYWSLWDLEGRAEKDFGLLWSFVAKRKCIVWHR